MKKIIVILLAVLMMVTASGLAEYDLSGMSEAELQNLQKAITDELASRKHQSDPSLDSDFLSDESRRDQFRSDISDMNIFNIRSAVEKYIAENEPAENDTVYAILDALTVIESDITVFNVERDAFDGSVITTYPGCEALSEDVCIVPVNKSGEYGCFRIGYVSDEWVFFDTIAISMNGNVIYEREYDSRDIQDNVDGGTVSEWVDDWLEICDVEDEEFLNDNTFAIRFLNTSKDVYLDHVLSETEKAGIYYTWRLNGDMNKFYKIWSDYDTMLMMKKLGK